MDLNEPVNAAQKNATGRNALVNSFGDQTNDFLTRFKGAIGGQESTSGTAARLGERFNLPALQNTAFSLNQTLNNIPQVQQRATTGFDVNNNQMQRLIAQKQSEIAPAAQQATAQAQNAQQLVSTNLGYEQADKDRSLMPYQTEAQLMPGVQSLKLSGYNQGAADEMTALLQKQSSGITLSEGEKNRMNQLATAEMTHKDNAAQINQGNFVQTNGGLYNISTGQFVVKPSLGSDRYKV